MTRRSLLAALLVAGLAPAPHASAQSGRSVKTYIALGDSQAFGETDVLPVSYGDQGYVKPFADWLATQFDGKRPKVINLAISGETSDSFFTGTLPPWWDRATLANLNYTRPDQKQFRLFLDAVAAEKAAGHQVKVVSFALGANDLGVLLASPDWNDPDADQVALLNEGFDNLEDNYIAFLTRLRAELPHAQVLLPTYYNPYDFLGPDDPTNQFNTYVVRRHAAMVGRLARRFKAHAVDIYTPFLGHALDYTFVGEGDGSNTHPNAIGYAVIAQQLIDVFDD